jgi:hypothetical protein
MYGSMEIGRYETDVTTGEKDIGQDQRHEYGSAEVGNPETVGGTGEKVTGDN